MSKKLFIAFMGMMIMLSMLHAVNAIGITPGRVTLEYEAGAVKTIEFTVLNNEHKDMKVLLGVIGDLAGQVSLSTKSLNFAANEESKTFSYTVTLPAGLSGGSHEARIAAAELPPEGTEGGAFIGANEQVYIGSTVVVTSQLLVKVPYPYKYAETRLAVKEPNVNGTAKFYLEVDNLGQHDLPNMQALIEIYGPTNEKLAAVKTDMKMIESGKKSELAAEWKADVNAGQYRAVATLVYDDGKLATAEKIFSVGSLELEISDISVKNFRLGDIAKFEITVQNKWSSAIKDVYAQLQLSDASNQRVADVKTASLDVPSLGKQVLTAFWDTAGIREGAYSGKMLLYYSGKMQEKELKTQITLNSIQVEIVGAGITAHATAEVGGNQNLVAILIIVLIVINIAWFIYFRRRNRKK